MQSNDAYHVNDSGIWLDVKSLVDYFKEGLDFILNKKWPILRWIDQNAEYLIIRIFWVLWYEVGNGKIYEYEVNLAIEFM